MTWEETKKKFLDEIRLRSYDDKFVDRKEEREILQMGLINDIDVESARTLLLDFCQASKSVLVTRVRGQVKDHLDAACAEQGEIDEAIFFETIGKCNEWTKSKITDQEAKRLIMDVLEFYGYPITQGWLGNWVEEMKRDLPPST